MPDPNPPATPQQLTGNAGELLICQHLIDHGWQILARQWHCRWGELDIVARLDPYLAFVEVKTRQPHNWDQSGRLSVDSRKQCKLIRSANAFLSRFPELADHDCRFDVALVEHRTGRGIPQWILLDYMAGAFEVS